MFETELAQRSDLPWTASRCNRTLRLLTTHLAKLEKLHKNHSNLPSQTAKANDNEPRDDASDRIEPISDPSWLSNAQRNIPLKSYRKRRQMFHDDPRTKFPNCVPMTPKWSKSLPADLIIDTPIMSRETTSNVDSSLQGPSRDPPTSMQPPTARSFPTTTIMYILDKFLMATSAAGLASDQDAKSYSCTKGSRSLVSHCLEKVPDIIIEDQIQYDSTANDNDGGVQLAAALLTELQNRYGDDVYGWGPLRMITRTYGIALICNAIRSGILGEKIAMELGLHFSRNHTMRDAADAITHAILQIQEIEGLGDLTDYLQAYSSHIQPASSAAAFTVGMSDLFIRRLSMTASKQFFVGHWPLELIKLCAQENVTNAMPLLNTLFSRYLGLEEKKNNKVMERLRSGQSQSVVNAIREGSHCQEVPRPNPVGRLTQTFRSGLIVLVSFALRAKMGYSLDWPDENYGNKSQHLALRVLESTCLTIRREVELHGTGLMTEEKLERWIAALFAFGVMSTAGSSSCVKGSEAECIEKLIRATANQDKVVRDLSYLLLGTARATNKAFAKKGRKGTLAVLKIITDCLICPKYNQSPLLAFILSHATMEAAMSYARVDICGAQDHIEALSWADELQCRLELHLGRQNVIPEMLSTHPVELGYHWDNCIAEWIAKAPAEAMSQMKQKEPKQERDVALPLACIAETFSQTEKGKPALQRLDQDQHLRTSSSKRLGKRRSAAEAWQWDGDFAFKRPAKKGKSVRAALGLNRLIKSSKPMPEYAFESDGEDELSFG